MFGLGIPELLVLLLVLGLLFLPTFVAWQRSHPNFWAIVAVNLLLGWSGIGWLAALVWAFVGSPKETPDPNDS